MAKPINDEHALLCGMVWGMAMKYGLPLGPTRDEDDDYTDTLELLIPEGSFAANSPPVRVFLTVQPPLVDGHV